MALTDKERTKLVMKAHADIAGAKTAKDIRKVFEHKGYGYLVLGHKILGRLLIGKSVEEATARRGKKED